MLRLIFQQDNKDELLKTIRNKMVEKDDQRIEFLLQRIDTMKKEDLETLGKTFGGRLLLFKK